MIFLQLIFFALLRKYFCRSHNRRPYLINDIIRNLGEADGKIS